MHIAIIGAGAAGMMAAARVSELIGYNGHVTKFKNGNVPKVTLIERNNILGQKVLISGGGRCNVTTGEQDIKETLKKYPRGDKFLRTAMYAFSPQDVYELFEEHGVPLKIEEDLRVFPISNNGEDVVGVFRKIFKDQRVEILYGKTVESVEKLDSIFKLKLKDRAELEADKLILATGGQAYRHTGSKGDGYDFAISLGHTITDLAPGLSAYTLKEQWIKDLAGVSFKDVSLKFLGSSKREFRGAILFTHKGVTGPAVFALSSLAAYENFDKDAPARLFVDFCPELNREELNAELINKIQKDPKKNFHNSLLDWLPKSCAKAICEANAVNPSKNNAELSKKERNKIIEALKNTELSIVARSAGDEFITAGGIPLKEVDSKTMESKICSGLYLTGELLDIDGFTGGYNLQAAWCTGRLAGESAYKSF